jgi:hypothetical protein
MRTPKSLIFTLLLLCCLPATAKKKKSDIPPEVLQARTVLVVIDPNAGMAIDDPNANNMARQAVEEAIQKWGRFQLVTDAQSADLIITVSKGNGRVAQGTIAGIPNYGPSTTNTEDPEDPSQRNPQMGQPGSRQSPGPQGPEPQISAGSSKDTMTVYRGNIDHALDSPALWRYTAKDALESPSVPAVEVFRKQIAEAEKQQAGHP